MGAPQVLQRYFDDLRDPRAETAALLGHNRYSTNTWPSFMRVQPFSVLGHNGEINTIARLRSEARMLGAPIRDDSSDSQDLNRLIETLIHRRGLSLPEAMELAVPPIVNEIRQFPEDLRGFYMYLRQAMGPFAQGPIALIARHGDELVFSVDALGLRPLWQIEAHDAYVFSSEPGVVSVADMTGEPKPLVAGREGDGADQARPRARASTTTRRCSGSSTSAGSSAPAPRRSPASSRRSRPAARSRARRSPATTPPGPSEPVKVEEQVLAGMGWQREDMKLVQQMASNGAEPIGSLGYDGPLAALSPERQNLADYFKETVAVVTNPAIDREREIEHFSCRAVFGARPSIDQPGRRPAHDRDRVPDHPRRPPRHGAALGRGLPAGREGAQDLPARGPLGVLPRARARVLDISCLEAETDAGRARAPEVRGREEGARRRRAARALRPHRLRGRAAVPRPAPRAVGDRRARCASTASSRARRTCAAAPSIVLRSGAIRNVHDVCMALGLGADGVCPYVMIEVICVDDYEQRHLEHLLGAAQGHREGDLDARHPRGARLRAPVLGDRAEARAGRDLRDARLLRLATRPAPASPSSTPRPPCASGSSPAQEEASRRRRSASTRRSTRPRSRPRTAARRFEEYSAKVRELEREQPISMRHILDLKSDREPIDPSQVDPGVGHHSYPIVISSMSFGSQGETAFRAYPEAAKRHQHRLRQRRGRRDPRHVRQVPAVARAAGRVRPLRRHLGDAQLLLPGRDQDRPGREAGRGRPPAGQEGLREGRRRA